MVLILSLIVFFILSFFSISFGAYDVYTYPLPSYKIEKIKKINDLVYVKIYDYIFNLPLQKRYIFLQKLKEISLKLNKFIDNAVSRSYYSKKDLEKAIYKIRLYNDVNLILRGFIKQLENERANFSKEEVKIVKDELNLKNNKKKIIDTKI